MTVESPLVSVLVGTFNRKRFLPTAVHSIQAQTYSNWELMLVNDGGEPVDDVVRRAEDKRIKLINLERNLGKGAAVNRGFNESRGSVIAYTDDDDIWYPDHLERLLFPLMNIPNVKMAYSDCYEVIILGVVEDERLEDRVEAILVVTGLGAKSIDEAISGMPRVNTQKTNTTSPIRENSMDTPVLVAVSPNGQDPYYAANASNLDLPAFLRRPR